MASTYRARAILALSFVLLSLPVAVNAATTSRQPLPFPVGLSTWFGSNYNTTSQHDGILKIGGWGDEYDSLVRFDLSGLPVTATQAIVYLYSTGVGTTDLNWYRSNTQWRTSTVTYATQPGRTYLGYTPKPLSAGWYGVDITTQYNQWRGNGSSILNYGLTIAPVSNNNNFTQFYGSAHGTEWQRPQIYVTYNPTGTDNIPKFRWPLATPSYANRSVNHPFGVDWAGGSRCPSPNGPLKKHNGTDFAASAGTTIYAPEDGVVKEINSSNVSVNGYSIVMEHTRLDGSKYTTVIWHMQPNADSLVSNPGGFIPKGAPIGAVYNLGSNTHHHLGMRMAPYQAGVSGTGALPTTTCTDPNGVTYPAFPASFVDVNNTSNAIF